MDSTAHDFDALVRDGATSPVEGWDFSWFEGRATEERPPWGYARLLGERMGRARVSLDIDTGGGEVLAGAPAVPPCAAATESWPPNAAKATALLASRGIVVVATRAGEPLPFPDGVFDLVSARHPVRTDWAEVARVLAPGGTYFSQEVGPWSGAEVSEWFLGPQPEETWTGRDPEKARTAAEEAGLEVVDLRAVRLRMEFHDIGAVVHYLRKVVWMVPGFTVERYEDRLRELHELIEAEGGFLAHSSRFLIEARKPV
ncbi:methyltransferase domain-containing protein [Streptomyces sp. NPDC088768]|uniref:methyltransferase domain-containing protein n=1 Tax=Streptomyces sp. NPDC088768 TaxID=3365894 RepID=UPI0038098D43